MCNNPFQNIVWRQFLSHGFEIIDRKRTRDSITGFWCYVLKVAHPLRHLSIWLMFLSMQIQLAYWDNITKCKTYHLYNNSNNNMDAFVLVHLPEDGIWLYWNSMGAHFHWPERMRGLCCLPWCINVCAACTQKNIVFHQIDICVTSMLYAFHMGDLQWSTWETLKLFRKGNFAFLGKDILHSNNKLKLFNWFNYSRLTNIKKRAY